MDSEVEILKKALEDKEAELRVVNDEYKELKERIMRGNLQAESDTNPTEHGFHSVQEKLSFVENQMESQRNEISSLNGLIRQDQEKLVETEQELIEYKNKFQSLKQYTDNLEAKFGKQYNDKNQETSSAAEGSNLNEKIDLLEGLKQKLLKQNATISVQKLKELLAETVDVDTRSSTQEGSQAEEQNKNLELICQYKEEIARLNRELENKDDECKGAEFRVDQMQEQIKTLSLQLQQKELEEIQEESELERTRHEIQNLRETLEETDKQIQELNYKLNISHDRSKDLETHFEIQDSSSPTKDLEELKKNLKEMGTELSLLSEKIKFEKENNLKLMRENEKNVKESKIKEKKLSTQKNEINDLKMSLSKEKMKASDLERKIVKLTRELDEKSRKSFTSKGQRESLGNKRQDSEKSLSRSPERRLRKSNTFEEGSDIDFAFHKIESENIHLADKLTKMIETMEILSTRVTELHEEKMKIEEEVRNRDSIIDELKVRYEENNELLVFVQKVEDENLFLSDKLNSMMEDMQLLANKVTSIQKEKAQLKEEVMQRESLIQQITDKYNENNQIFDVASDLQDENKRLTERLDRMVKDVSLLSHKFILIQDEKRNLEDNALEKDLIIEKLLQKYQEMEKALESYRNDQGDGIQLTEDFSIPLIPKARISAHEREGMLLSKSSIQMKGGHLEIETDHNSAHFRTLTGLTGLEDHLVRNKPTKAFGVKSMITPTLVDSFTYPEMAAFPSRNDLVSESPIVMGPKCSKYLYAKTSRLTQPSYLRIEGDNVIISENYLNLKTNKMPPSQVKAERSVDFEKVIQKSADLDLRVFNLREENLLGKNLFFMIYGAKRTEKKILKYKLITEFIETFKTMIQKNPQKICRVVIRVQDEKFFKKLEAVKNFEALEQFANHQEFIIGDAKEQNENNIDHFISSLKQLDVQGSVHSPRVTASSEKIIPPPKEIFVEFLVQNKEESEELLSEERASAYSARTKLMIVTTNSVKEDKEFENLHSVDSLVDFVLTGNKKEHVEDISENEKSLQAQTVQKFLILSIQPSLQAPKNISNTLALAFRFQDILKPDRKQSPIERHHNRKESNKIGFEAIDSRMTPVKKEKLYNLKLLQNSETPKNLKKKALISEISAGMGKNFGRKSEVCTTDRRPQKDEPQSKRDLEKTAWIIEPNDQFRS